MCCERDRGKTDCSTPTQSPAVSEKEVKINISGYKFDPASLPLMPAGQLPGRIRILPVIPWSVMMAVGLPQDCQMEQRSVSPLTKPEVIPTTAVFILQ
jgi:hypothetical protein